jgi:membrane protein DedA with SNARE-associated domain
MPAFLSESFLSSIAQYSYLAIFLFVLLQETGLPSPVPNEYVLVFSGYLSSTGVFKLYLVLLSVIAADLVAGFLLYELFYHSGKLIIRKKPAWLKLPSKRLAKLSIRLRRSKNREPFIGRLTPFIRGWVSVMSGLLQLPQGKYSLVLISTSVIWSLVYVGSGYLLGPYWKLLAENNLFVGIILFLLPLVVFFVIRFIKSKNKTLSFHKI